MAHLIVSPEVWVPLVVAAGVLLVAALLVVPFVTDLRRYVRMRRM
jgi:hypothetical protein